MTSDVVSPAQTFRPSRELYRQAVRRDLVIAVPLLVLVVGSQVFLRLQRSDASSGAIALYLGVLVAGVVFAVVYYRLVLRNSRIELGEAGLTVTNWVGRTRTVGYAGAGTVLQAVIRSPSRPMPMLFVLDRSGRRALTMYGTLWPTETMVEVSNSIGLTPTTFPGPVTYRELRRLHPKAISWARAHPVAIAVIVAVTFFVVIAVVLVALFTVMIGEIVR